MECEFCEEEAVTAFGQEPNEDIHLCQKHISECLSIHYQNERR